MRLRTSILAGFALAALVGTSAMAQDSEPKVQTVEGRLAPGDETTNDGSYAQEYSLLLVAGQRVKIELASADFDTYVVATGPNLEVGNDDGPNSGTNSELVFSAPESGEYSVIATSFTPGETGAFRLRVTIY